MRAWELSAALVGFASAAVASTPLQERDIVRCTTTQDCQGSGVYLPPNSVPSCSPRRTCTYGEFASRLLCGGNSTRRRVLTMFEFAACNDGFVSANGRCQQVCQTDSDCTIGATSWNSHLACISGSCGWGE